MSFTSLLGFRYLKAKRGTNFISLISGFSIVGVALGVCTLIVVLSVMDGFEGALKDRLAKGEFHVLITAAPDRESPYFTFSESNVSHVFGVDTSVVAVNPVLKTEAIVRARKRVSGVSLRGITEPHMNLVSKLLIEAAETDVDDRKIVSNNGLWMGKELAYQLHILPGDKVTIISPTETEGPFESVPRIRKFRVEGIYESGIPEKDLHVVYAPLVAVREFLRRPDLINQVEIQTSNFQASTGVSKKLRGVMGEDFLIKDWKDMNAHLFASLRLERISMFVILAMIVLVASFNIVTSLSMLVTEKRKDIAILRAMGATARQIGRIFLLQGAVIGNIGTVLGLVSGITICLLLKNYQIVELPDIFYDRSLPIRISPLYILMIAVTSVMIVLLAAWFPARRAARISPVEGFRGE